MNVNHSGARVLVIIAAYNEEENIFRTVSNLTSHYPEYDYVVINDGSTDNTLQILEEYHFNYVNLPVNLGIGGAVQTGYLYARDQGYDIAVQMDGDGQHDPAYIGALIAPIESGAADYVVGSRFIDKEGFQSTGIRRTGIRFLSGLIRLLTGRHVLDVTSGFRAVDRHFIGEFAEDYPIDYPEPKAVMDAVMSGRGVREVPVRMREREGGRSSITLWKSAYYMIKVSLDILIRRISLGFRDRGGE
jgi:glycosyltransferase involved in cell wall biosynthesis